MSAILQKWTFETEDWSREIIFPDGCRDLICFIYSDKPAEWKVSRLQSEPEIVAIGPDAKLIGYRLAPGAMVPAGFLESLVKVPNDQSALASAVDANTPAAEGISALERAQSVATAAKACGVSERSLHRMVTFGTGKTPSFWLRLARARRAAADVALPLAQLAGEHGFSDQAHMTREFRRWFGLTPRDLRADATLAEQLYQPALATGEQISMRKPFVSQT
jgi:AraC-like DNA-binding protein